MKAVVKETTKAYVERSIDIPKIVVVPKGEVTCGFEDFDLDVGNINLQPVAKDLISQGLHNGERLKLMDGDGIVEEERPEDYLVRGLIDFDDVSYDDNAELLYKLAGQIVAHLRSYLAGEDEVLNVLQYHQRTLVNLIHAQMQDHFFENATEYEAHVSKGFTVLRPNNYPVTEGDAIRDVRIPVAEAQNIRKMLFGHFKKCLYRAQKFDSDTERRFALMIENDDDVKKWVKPARTHFQIHYREESAYEPDFVVETDDVKYLCEPKRATEIDTPEVQDKARAAATWCQHATDHANQNGGKPWVYLLIPHDAISENKTLKGLATAYKFG